jgi:hypothetical protein
MNRLNKEERTTIVAALVEGIDHGDPTFPRRDIGWSPVHFCRKRRVLLVNELGR